MKKNILSFLIGLALAVSFVLLKNSVTYRIKKPYGISGALCRERIDTLFLGSSCFRQGISMRVIDNYLDENSFLIAYGGNQPIFIFFELDLLFAHDVKPKRVFVDMHAMTAAAQPKLSEVRIIFDMDFKTKMKAWKMISPFVDNLLAQWWEFWITANSELFITYPVSRKFIDRRYYKGGPVDFSKGSSPEEMSAKKIPDIPEKLNGIQKDAILSLARLCLENGVELAFIEPPLFSKFRNDYRYKIIFDEYRRFLDDNEMNYLGASPEVSSSR